MQRPLIGTVVLAAVLVALTLFRPAWAQTPTPPASLMIVNGQPAKVGEFPALVALLKRQREPGMLFIYQNCGGTLIADRWVLTAAHCILDAPQNFRVTLGNLSALNEDNQGQIAKVSAVIPHPGYDPISATNDIALVRLAEPVDFSKTKLVTATLLSLAEEATLAAPAVKAVAVGWGDIFTDTSKNQNCSRKQRFLFFPMPIATSLPCIMVKFRRICSVQAPLKGAKGFAMEIAGGPCLSQRGMSWSKRGSRVGEETVPHPIALESSRGWPAIMIGLRATQVGACLRLS